MKKFPKIIILSSLLVLSTALVVQAEPANSYVDALSSEADETKMKAGDTVSTNDDPEPAVTPDGSIDTDALADKVGNQLEKILSGAADGDVKQADLANVVSDAVKEGHDIDDIQNAVSEAMSELQKKEGVDIKPEVFKFVEKAVSDIVGASKDIAQGDPNDPYIQSLNAEVDDTSLKDNEGKDKKPEEKTAETSKEKAPEETAKKEPDASATPETVKAEDSEKATETAKSVEPEKASEETKTAINTENDSVRTIIVLKGESLSKIAAKIYGSGRKYPILFEANKDTLSNPNSISVGQILKVPPLPTE